MAARSAADIRAALREKYSPRVMTYLRRIDTAEERAPIIAGYLSGDLTVEGVRVAVEQLPAERKTREEQLSEPVLTETQPDARASTMSSSEDEGQREQDEQKASLLKHIREAHADSTTTTHDTSSESNHITSERTSKI